MPAKPRPYTLFSFHEHLQNTALQATKFPTPTMLTIVHLLPILPIPPALSRQIPHLHDCESGDAECAHDKNYDLQEKFSCSNPPVLCYNGTLLENVQELKCFGMTLSHNGRTTNA